MLTLLDIAIQWAHQEPYNYEDTESHARQRLGRAILKFRETGRLPEGVAPHVVNHKDEEVRADALNQPLNTHCGESSLQMLYSALQFAITTEADDEACAHIVSAWLYGVYVCLFG